MTTGDHSEELNKSDSQMLCGVSSVEIIRYKKQT